nr:l-type lectin-domain containing receptor kinase ix.1 [Quercus suber]
MGDAVSFMGFVDMNRVEYYRVGWAVYAKKVPLWDPNIGKLSYFTTHFSFTIGTVGSGTSDFGDGLAFFLAPTRFIIPPNTEGGGLGLLNSTNYFSGQNQIVLVEFDSNVNNEWDPPFAHVGINSNSIAFVTYTRWNTSFHSGDTADVLIIYNATTKNLSVSWTYRKTTNTEESTSLSYQIDLMKVLPEWVTVGFSAATGLQIKPHLLQSWEFSSSLDIKETSGKVAKNESLIVGLTVALAGVVIIIVFVML